MNLARAVRGIIGIEISEDETLNLAAQLDASVLGSGREQQDQKAHNVTATMGYIVDFVQEQRDARLTELLALRFHRMLTYSVPYRPQHPWPLPARRWSSTRTGLRPTATKRGA